MQVAINITFGDGETLYGAVKALLGMPDDAEVVAPSERAVEAFGDLMTNAPKRRTRKAKEEAAEQIVETVKTFMGKPTADVAQNDSAGAVENVEKPTFDDVRKATTRLAEGCGLDIAKKLRDEFNVKKINDIPEVEWFNFIQKAEQLIANKETEVA